jgi:hypothetical protein
MLGCGCDYSDNITQGQIQEFLKGGVQRIFLKKGGVQPLTRDNLY